MFARTPRLFLRPGWPEDAPAVAAAIGHYAVLSRLEKVPHPYTLDHAAEWLGRPHDPSGATFLVLSHEGAYPAIVGSVGLIPQDGALVLGYWYTPAAWGRGYATEAGRAAIGIARHALGATRLASRHHHDNPASGTVLRKLGFVPTGETRAIPSLARGYAVDSVMLELDLVGAVAEREVSSLAA